jgi:hypothetical protein
MPAAVNNEKKCSRCRKIKDLKDFSKCAGRKDGFEYSCKECHKEYYLSRQEEIKEKFRENRLKDPEKYKERDKTYYLKKREKKGYKETRRKYYENNKKIISNRMNERKRERRLFDVKWNLDNRISLSIWHSLKERKNGISWKNILGYNENILFEHLTKTIQDGFCWKDFLDGKLHIDHIIPKKIFIYDSYEDKEFKKCWNYRNLRLLSKKENSSKRDKLDMELVKKYNIEDLLPKEIING